MTVIRSANSIERFCIIGGGVIGQLTALALLDRGWRGGVILESSMPPASLAGGGILSPMFPWRYTKALNRLAEPGCESYRTLVERLSAAGCMEAADFNPSGIWMELQSHEEEPFLYWESYARHEHFSESRSVSGEQRRGIYFPNLGSIRSPGVMRGLRRYLRANGVTFRHSEALGWNEKGGAARVNLDDGSTLDCQTLVIAAGAGARKLLPTPVDQFPAKGEMLMYRLGDDAPKQLLLAREGYVIPRSNGDTVVGSTLRRGDATVYPTVAGRYQLERLAATLLPQCLGRKPDAHWAGVRPGLDRDYPYIGRIPGAKHVFAAIGHYRNGLVCAPATAALLGQIISGEIPDLDAQDYSLPSSRSSSSFFKR